MAGSVPMYLKFWIRLRLRNRTFKRNVSYQFVPKHAPCNPDDVYTLQNFINKHNSLFVLTGAGVSTESGLPDYRSKDVGLYDRSPNRPVQYLDFIAKEHVRKRYWARNYIGWNRFSTVEPNKTHHTLALWESKKLINWLVTQNVDRLHHKAGSKRVIELHGTSYIVKCLSCSNLISRHDLQSEFKNLNPNFNFEPTEIRPDADTEIDESLINTFQVPPCSKCGGCLKPDVVFFGENVPKEKVYDVYNKVKESDAVLTIGSSLEVFSGYRFISAAYELKKSICIINIGPTRADRLATCKINVRCGDIISKIQV